MDAEGHLVSPISLETPADSSKAPEQNIGPNIVWGPAALDARRKLTREKLSGIASGLNAWINKNRYYYRSIHRLLRFLVEPGKKVLSLRCGPGRQLAEVRPGQGVGIDISEEMVQIAKSAYPQFKFRVGFPDTDEFKQHFSNGEIFDYIMVNAINDTVDVQAELENLKTVADQRTRFIVVAYNHLWELFVLLAEKLGLKVPTADQNWLSEADIINFLEAGGYEALKTYRIVLFPKYLPLISEFLNRFCARLPGLNRLCMIQVIVARIRPEPIRPDDLSVSVIIPCKDEKDNVAGAVRRMPKLGRKTEIIFCDDKSTDGTAEEVRRLQAAYPDKGIRLVTGPGICKSKNVWTGFEAATGDVLMILDADLTTMPEELPSFLQLIASGRAEFVNGSRLIYPMPISAMKGANMIGNKFFSLAFSYLLGQRVKDTLCGTKVLWRHDWDRIKPLVGTWGTMDRWGDYDLLFGASKLNLRILDLPIHYQERIYGTTKMTRVFRNGVVMLRMCFHGFARLKLGY